jgi:two-component system LytT family sensor kinase
MNTTAQRFSAVDAGPQPSEPALSVSEGSWRAGVFWLFQCLFWVLLALLSLGMSRAIAPAAPIAWGSTITRMLSGFLLTAGVYWLFQAPRIRRLSRLVRWPLMIVVAVGLLLASLAPMLLTGIGSDVVWIGGNPLAHVVPRTAAGIFWCTACFTFELLDGLYAAEIRLVQAAADAARTEAKALRHEALASQHEAHRLQAQMNPHFLFNALNAVVSHENCPPDVAQVTQDLADFLRSALRESRLLEPLSRELQALEKYLAVQQARFGAGLTCRIVCDRRARAVLVPPMTVQPLLENAIAYGLQTSDKPLRVEVTAGVSGGWLEIRVMNTGRWAAPDAARSPGTGLRILRKRLQLLVGPEATVDVVAETAKQPPEVEVVVRIPVDQQPERNPPVPHPHEEPVA